MNSPFNEQRYTDLLEGLEITEMLFSDYSKTYRLRLDSEYYSKRFLINERYLTSDVRILDFCRSDILNIKNLSLNKDFNYLEISDVKTNGIDYDYDNVNHKAIPDRATYILRNNDVVVSTVRPNRNSVAFIHNARRLIGTSGFAVLRAAKNKVSPYYLYAFCKTKYFITKLMRENSATMYPAVSEYDVFNVKIPFLSYGSQETVENTVKKAFRAIKQSQSLYNQAETLFLESIGLNDFTPSPKPTNIKWFKESFWATGRLDAEYYQPKYEEIIIKLKKQPHDILGNLVTVKKSIEPGSDVYSNEGLPFIRVSDYDNFGISTPEKCLSSGFCGENAALLQSLYPTKETILFSKDGSVGVAFMVREDMRAVTSGAILHLTVRDKTRVLPEYLSLALNSAVVKMQAERDAGGSIILHWRVNEIENVIVPVVEYDIQKHITKLIKESFTFRAESERLLEEAKKMMEREIETAQ